MISLFVGLYLTVSPYRINILSASREEILRKTRPSGQSRADPYTPNLQYLDKSTDTSLAGRLAKQWRKQEEPAQVPSRPEPRLEVYYRDAKIAPRAETKPREPRIDHTIAQRRAERLAREEALKKSPQRKWSAQRRTPSEEQAQLERHRQWVFEGTESLAADGFTQPDRRRYNSDNQQARRGRPNRGRGGSQVGAGQKGGRSGGGLVIARPQKVKEDEGGESQEDISLETLEEGCDAKVPSARTTPASPPAHLDAVFGHSSATPLNIIATSQDTKPDAQQPRDRTQWIRESFGGDYSRFAQHSPDLYLASHRTLGPSKHAELVLSKRKDIVIAGRHRAQEIIESATVRST